MKTSWRFDDKISYAAKVLPHHLKPQGTNPLDALHDLASDGIHNRSEDECLEIFDRCKAAFEYVFRELDVQIEDAKAYLAALGAIGRRQLPPQKNRLTPQIAKCAMCGALARMREL